MRVVSGPIHRLCRDHREDRRHCLLHSQREREREREEEEVEGREEEDKTRRRRQRESWKRHRE